MRKLVLVLVIPLLLASCGATVYSAKPYSKVAKKNSGVGYEMWYEYLDYYNLPSFGPLSDGWYEAIMTNGCSELEMVLVELEDNKICRFRVNWPKQKTINLDNLSEDRKPIQLNNGIGLYDVVSKNARYMFVIHNKII